MVVVRMVVAVLLGCVSIFLWVWGRGGGWVMSRGGCGVGSER